MRAIPAILFFLSLPLSSGAQTPPAPGASPSPAPPAAAPARPTTKGQELKIRADVQGGEKGHYFFQGFVDLREGDVVLLADRADVYEVDSPDGTSTRKVTAEGNVIFMRGDERVSAERATLDVDTGAGVFEKAIGYVPPGVFIEAKTIERVDENTYRIEGGQFSSCTQPDPRWGFSATTAKVELGDKIVAKNFVFRVKGVPAFYLPVFAYPIHEEQRASGLLTPTLGYSSFRGFTYGDGYFWAMGRSADQTFSFNHSSNFGWGFGDEFRYALDSPSKGKFRTYLMQDSPGGPLDYDLDYNALQALPLGIRASLVVRRYANLFFQRQFQDTVDFATSRTERSSLSLQRSYGPTNLRLTLDDTNTYFQGDSGPQTRQNVHLPSFTINQSSVKIGNTGILFTGSAAAEKLGYGDTSVSPTTNFYSRFDIYPQISRPFSLAFFQITPTVRYRDTYYGETLDVTNDSGFLPRSLNRRFFETSFQVIGPTFSKVFDSPGGFYADKFKHTIGPEVNWRYRSAVDLFGTIPKFDSVDTLLGTNQIDYAIVQHFYAKRPGPGGKPTPWEFFTWRIGQTYYVQVKDKQNQFDPNYASSAFGPQGVPSHNSPVQSQMKFRPNTTFATTFNLEYDVNFKQLRNLSLTQSAASGIGTLNVSLVKADTLNTVAVLRTPTLDTIRMDGVLKVVPNAVTLGGGLVYDLLPNTPGAGTTHGLISGSVKLHYQIQCCGVLLEGDDLLFNGHHDTVLRFSFELANVGSIGSYIGTDPTKAFAQLGGYR